MTHKRYYENSMTTRRTKVGSKNLQQSTITDRHTWVDLKSTEMHSAEESQEMING